MSESLPPITALDVVAVHPSLTDDEAQALAAWYATYRAPAPVDVDLLSDRERDELLLLYFGLLSNTNPAIAIARALAGEEPDESAMGHASFAESFTRSRTAVRRTFERIELRAAAHLAAAMLRCSGGRAA